ncbi:hypothetical protein ACFSJ3_04005 [Corallincola platygyrae]|uniref:Uncharacterized protein n=1 Tax=Corallincola platygyrae TaxID=1193278 RepID=A0ABW4XHY4_9GAMM
MPNKQNNQALVAVQPGGQLPLRDGAALAVYRGVKRPEVPRL